VTFLTALLTGLGVGSGGLYIFYLTLIRDLPQTTAQGINLLFFITASISAATVNLIKKRISFLPVIIILPVGITSAFFGFRLATVIPIGALKTAFGIFISLVGVLGLIFEIKTSKKKK